MAADKVFEPTLDFRNSQYFQVKDKKYWEICSAIDFVRPTWEKIALPYTSPS